MAKRNIVYHNMRLNLDNEQHYRVNRVLANLNTEIYKSVNQFLVDVVDHYISGDNGSLTRNKDTNQEKDYISKADVEKLKREIKDEMKNEMIIILGSIVTGGISRTVPEAYLTSTRECAEESGNAEMEELVNRWG